MPTLAEIARQAGAKGGGSGSKNNKKGRPPSTVDQARTIAAGLPRGLIELGKDVVGSTIGGAVRGALDPKWHKRRKGESIEEYDDRVRPLQSAIANSYKRTGGRLAQVAAAAMPGGMKLSETDYAKASRDGEIVGTVLEDVANIVGAGKVVGRAAEHAAVKATQAGNLGRAAAATKVQKVAEAPLVPGRKAKAATAKAARKAYNVASSERMPRARGTLRALKLDPESVALVRETLRPSRDKLTELKGDALKRGKQAIEGLDADELIARKLIAEGEAVALTKLRQVAPDQLEPFLKERYGDSVTVRGVHLAADIAEGKLPELKAKIRDSLNVSKAERAATSQRLYDQGPGHAEQAGWSPMSVAFENDSRLRFLKRELEKTEPVLEKKFDQSVKQEMRRRTLEDAEAQRPTAGAPEAPRPPGVPRYEQAVRGAGRAEAKLAEVNRRAQAEAAKVAKAEVESLRSSTAADVKDVRRQFSKRMAEEADSIERALAELDTARPPRPRKGDGMYDFGQKIEKALGKHWVGHHIWGKADDAGRRAVGGLDELMDSWARRFSLEGSTDDIVEHFIAWNKAAKDQRAARKSIVSEGNYDAARLAQNEYEARALSPGAPEEVAKSIADDFADATYEEALQRVLDRHAPTPAELRGELLERPALPDQPRYTPNAADKAEMAAAAIPPAREKALGNVESAALKRGRELGKVEQRAKIAEREATKVETRADRLHRLIEQRTDQIANSITAAPSRLRPILATNRAVADHLKKMVDETAKSGVDPGYLAQVIDDIPTTLQELAELGVDFEYFPHLRESMAAPGAFRKGELPKHRKTRAERLRKGDPDYDRSVKAEVLAEWDQMEQHIARQTIGEIAEKFGKRFDSMADAQAAGYIGWDPKALFEKSNVMTDSTVFIPEHLFQNFRSWYAPSKWKDFGPLRAYDATTNAFRVSVLALSPRWQVNNLVGNAMLATIGAGVDPITLIRSVGAAVKAWKAAGKDWDGVAPRRLYDTGLTHQELAPVFQSVNTRNSAIAKLMKVPEAAYRLNSFVDNVGRTAVFMAKKGKGMSDEAAVKASLKAMGDFSNMTPFERNVVRRIIPFYAWSRHVTKLSFSLPWEHPLRVAWVAQISNLWGDDDIMEGLLEYMRGGVRFGESFISTNAINPFGELGGPLGDGQGIVRSLHPAIKLATENLGIPAGGKGTNTFTGRPYTRPTGSGDLDETGRELPTAPSLVNQALNLSPLARAVRSGLGYDRILRYESGDPIIIRGKPIEVKERGPARALGNFFGLPVRSLSSAVEATRRAEIRRQRSLTAREKYAEQRRRLGL